MWPRSLSPLFSFPLSSRFLFKHHNFPYYYSHAELTTQPFRKRVVVPPPRRKVLLPARLTARTLSPVFGIRVVDILKEMIKAGLDPQSPDENLDLEVVELIAQEHNLDLDMSHFEKPTANPDPNKIGNREKFTKRPPIVSIMGHVDHGKTTLLDTLRNTSIAAKEAGGITQHIGAFEVEADGETITFIDTPGHAAFSKIRMRGTRVADIVVLVIAADSGIQEQTEEILQFIEDSQVPMIIALNKIDKSNSNPQQVIKQLANRGIRVEQINGSIQCLEISAKNQIGIDQLLQAIKMESEFNDERYFVDYNAKAEAHVIDVHKERGKGTSAVALVYTGSLKIGDIFVCGKAYGKVRNIFDSSGNSLKVGLPAKPISIIGLKGHHDPHPGDQLIVVDSEQYAQQVVSYRLLDDYTGDQEALIREREATLHQQRISLLEAAGEGLEQVKEFIAEIREASHYKEEINYDRTINVIIRADVPGSIEGLESAISEIPAERFGIMINIMQSSIGTISDADVELARDSKAYLLAFNVRVSNTIQHLARTEQVAIHSANIIYMVVDDLVKEVEKKMPPEEKITVIGSARVLKPFVLSANQKKKRKTIAGSVVESGSVFRSQKNSLRVIRDGQIIYTAHAESLKHFSDDVNEVKKGKECGIRLEGWDDYQVDDIIECFEVSYLPPKLNWSYTKTGVQEEIE